MTYLQFHLLFILPPLIVLAARYHLRGISKTRNAHVRTWPVWAIAVVACVYTTPWDNLLVMTGVWSYGSERVLATIGYVPVEEYAFFFLQPLLTGYWYQTIRRRYDAPSSVSTGWKALDPAAITGGLFFAALTAVGVWALTMDQTYYLGCILSWAGPVGLFQWLLAGRLFWSSGRALPVGIAVPTLYLWIADRIAIGLEIWTISPAYTVGWDPFGLPVEEAIFFLLTNVMVVQGVAMLDNRGATPAGPSTPPGRGGE